MVKSKGSYRICQFFESAIMLMQKFVNRTLAYENKKV